LNFLGDPIEFLLMSTGRIPAIIFALSFHEAAHAWMALKCGDDTAARMGRITLNPMSHLDPIGSIGIFLGFFGWGRPVPYVERNLKDPRRDAMLIALAGPVSNIILAAISGILFRLSLWSLNFEWAQTETASRIVLFVVFLMGWSVFLNLCLALFNMIPVFPLDGEKVLIGLLPYRQAIAYASLRQYGPMGLLLLILVGGQLISAVVFVLGAPIAYLCSGFSMYHLLAVIYNTFEALWPS
jgi:Zn-dependent protease